MLKLTKPGVGLLTRQYRSVLRKCWMINVGLFALGAAMMPNEAEALYCLSQANDGHLFASNEVSNCPNGTVPLITGGWERLGIGASGYNNDHSQQALRQYYFLPGVSVATDRLSPRTDRSNFNGYGEAGLTTFGRTATFKFAESEYVGGYYPGTSYYEGSDLWNYFHNLGSEVIMSTVQNASIDSTTKELSITYSYMTYDDLTEKDKFFYDFAKKYGLLSDDHYGSDLQNYTFSDGTESIFGNVNVELSDIGLDGYNDQINMDLMKAIMNASDSSGSGSGGSGLTAGMALISDSNGKVAASAVTAAELGYLSGVSSNIQTQLNNKQETISDLATIRNNAATGAAKTSANNTTVTVKMNGANKTSFTLNNASNQTIDLGTVITEHQSLNDYYTKLDFAGESVMNHSHRSFGASPNVKRSSALFTPRKREAGGSNTTAANTPALKNIIIGRSLDQTSRFGGMTLLLCAPHTTPSAANDNYNDLMPTSRALMRVYAREVAPQFVSPSANDNENNKQDSIMDNIANTLDTTADKVPTVLPSWGTSLISGQSLNDVIDKFLQMTGLSKAGNDNLTTFKQAI